MDDEVKKPKIKKDIEEILEKLIEEVLKLGRAPTQIWLRDDHYQELRNKLSDNFYKDTKTIEGGIRYVDNNEVCELSGYKGIPVKHSNITCVRWD